MHIVQLVPELNQGGVETLVLSLNQKLVEQGHSSTVISAGGSMIPTLGKNGGQHITLDVCSKNPLTFFSRVLKLETKLGSLDASVLLVHSRVPAWLVWFANKRLKIPWITTVHGFNSISKYSEIMTKGDRVICVSNPIKEYILKNYSVDRKTIRVIHGCIDTKRFDPEKLNRATLEELESALSLQGKFVATMVGRITELKDHETFIRAIGLARETIPNLCGLIVGHVRSDKQNYYNRLRQLVDQLHLQDQIQFASECPTLPELYALSNVVVSCSKKPESFGLVLVEALAMNTPVIATRHGGPLDIILDQINGLFFTPQNHQELAERIFQTLEFNFQDLRPHVLKHFSLEHLIEKEVAVYRELVTEDRKPEK